MTSDQPAAPVAAHPAAAADDAFGADLYRVLASDAADVVFSPVSVASALRMAWYGARGQTAAELARALHLDGPPEAADEGPRLPSAWLRGSDRDGSATVRAPNTVWVQSGLPLRPEYTARLSAAAATLTGADFAGAPEAARAQINRVIAGQTEGKITGLLPPGAITALTSLVLASAVYLRAAWTEPFGESATRNAPFYPDGPGRPSLTVPMMNGTSTRAYVRGDGYQAVLLPYRDTSLAMAVVLPDGPLAALATSAGLAGAGLAGAGLAGLLAGTARHRVTLSMPRLRLESELDLVPALRRLGVSEAFGDRADFGGMTEAWPLRIGAVAHKAFIDVDEHGTEAAAATGVVMQMMAGLRRPPPPVTMVADRPFLFAIIDTATGLPLFWGQVSHPQAVPRS